MFRSFYRMTTLVGTGLALAMAVTVVYQIASRYSPIWSAPWTEEAARFMWIWVIALLAGPAYVHGGYVGIDLLPSALPRRAAVALRRIIHLVVAAYGAVLAVYGWELAARTSNQISPALGLNMSVINFAMAFAGFSLFLGGIYAFVRRPEPPAELTDDPFAEPVDPTSPGAER